jgi:hypothetical protein
VQFLLSGGMTYSIVACPSIGTDHAKKNHSSVAVYKPLLSSGCCVGAYFAVIAWQWVYMPQYVCLMGMMGNH